MPGTPTYGTVDGSPQSTTLSLHLIDASGDTWSDSLTIPAVISDAQADNIAGAYQDASNASLYRVTKMFNYEGDADPDNAVAAYRSGIDSGINLLFKNLTTLRTVTPRLVAPIAGVMQGNQDIPLLTSTELVALITELLVPLAGYNLVSGQYTDRRERRNNPRIKA